MAAAQSGSRTIEGAQDYYMGETNLGKPRFKASQVKLSFWDSIGLAFGMGGPNSHKDDHRKKGSGWYNFVSADSIFDYVDRTNEILLKVKICPQVGNQESRCNYPIANLLK